MAFSFSSLVCSGSRFAVVAFSFRTCLPFALCQISGGKKERAMFVGSKDPRPPSHGKTAAVAVPGYKRYLS